MKNTGRTYILHGVLNIVCELPMMLVVGMWTLLVGTHLDGALGRAVCYLPMLLPLTSCIIGIVRGARGGGHTPGARACFIMSSVGAVLFAALMCFALTL